MCNQIVKQHIYCHLKQIDKMNHDENNEMYDEIFLQVAGRAGSISNLLGAFFGFLNRKTDFYVQFQDGEKAKMGFPKDIPEKMVEIRIFCFEIYAHALFRFLNILKDFLFDHIKIVKRIR